MLHDQIDDNEDDGDNDDLSTCIEWRFFASERGDKGEGQRNSIDYEKEREGECVWVEKNDTGSKLNRRRKSDRQIER